MQNNFDNEYGSTLDKSTWKVVYKNGKKDAGGASYGLIHLASIER